MRTVRASEIGAYLYCRRAWWYQKRGVPSENQAELAGGSQLHFQHGRSLLAAGCLQAAAYILLAAAAGLLAFSLTMHFL
jgi:hypothetical protein